ncbi:MAG: hypothetical protein AB8I08_23590 [Sandaracinaceae bacterium]
MLSTIAVGQEVRLPDGEQGWVGWIGPGQEGDWRVRVDVEGAQRWVDLTNVSPLGAWTRAHWAALTKNSQVLSELTPKQLDAPTTETMILQFGSKARFRQHVPPGTTPLHIATLWPDTASIRALLAAGAQPRVRDTEGHLPGHAMCAVHANEVVEAARTLATTSPIAAALALEGAARGNGHVLMGLARGGFDFDAPLLAGPSLRGRFEDESRFGPSRKSILAAAARSANPDQLIDAPSGKTKCRGCGKKIGRGTPQFGSGTVQASGKVKRQWFHEACARRELGDARVSAAR